MGTHKEPVNSKMAKKKPAKTPVGGGAGSSRSLLRKSKPESGTIGTSKSKPTMEQNSKSQVGQSKRRAGEKKKKPPKAVEKYEFAIGELVDGVNQYKVVSQIRKSTKPLEVDVYVVKDVDQEEEFRMKVCTHEFQVLKTEAALLRKLEKKPGERCFLSLSEYGTVAKHKVEFLILSPYGMSLHEIMKKITSGSLSMDCAFSVGLSMLKGIKDLHSLGYIHRNIRPAAFTCGLADNDAKVFLQDFRSVRKFEEQKKHVTARSSVKMFGTIRFCSRACQNSKDQGRKDDLESWLYTLFYLIDNTSLAWKCDKNFETVNTAKEAFMHSEGNGQWSRAPRSLSTLISLTCGYEFASEPDYNTFKKVLNDAAVELKLNLKNCDWKGKGKELEGIDGDTNRSLDCKVTGDRDVVVRQQGKKKPTRKKLSGGDIIHCVGAPHGWVVLNLLGSGGFGDVYRVHRENQPPTKCYALKTESEEGEKRYLRLKVEVTVMMKTAEKKKENSFEHFIEFVDRGKCEELKCKYVVMGLVGPSLEDIRRKYLLASFSKHTAFNVSLQTVQGIKDLHSIGYLHRDIKPANYAVGLAEAESTVYMLDFGIAKLYVDETGAHKTPRKKVKFLGTLRYACRACMLQQEQGRRDDLETWLYLVFDIMDESNGMPWRRLCDAKEILKSKKEFFQDFNSFPFSSNLKRLRDLVMYIDKMQYETPPDYDYIVNFLKTTAKDVNAKIGRKLDWIGKLNKKEFESDSEKSDNKQSGDDDD